MVESMFAEPLLRCSDRMLRCRHLSILLKVGSLFVLLALTVATFLFTTSNLTGQLIGVSKAIEQAGTERMRIYKLASMIQQLDPSSDRERDVIRREIGQFERVVEALRSGAPQHSSVGAINPRLANQLQDLQDQWSVRLKPPLDRALETETPAAAVQEYLKYTDDFVSGWDHLVQSMEKEAAGRLQSLYYRLTWFLLAFVGLMAGALFFLDRVVRAPLRKLTAGAERLGAGEFETDIQVESNDELGQLARTFRRMAETIRHHIGELNSLHATGQEIAMLGSGGLEDVLRRIADRAAES